MKIKAKIGPTHDTAFFDDLQAVFDRHPDVAKNYSVRHIGRVVDFMKVDFGRQVAMSNVQDGEIVTKFVDRIPDPIPDMPTDLGCCAWKLTAHEWRCVEYCIMAPPE
ncbi:hypothetical protein M2271_002504 [Streptomyces sp. LBL]|uniref:hypothetical protein n=1 Tax=Streptomyces sp. LBL TaxID=2940562 RepID=UPI0024764692|nr:hypothetical protein [Streptomyces sp. LBL]MDH6624700.1 hypothetical protein [Streptomyces sp. LBL]